MGPVQYSSSLEQKEEQSKRLPLMLMVLKRKDCVSFQVNSQDFKSGLTLDFECPLNLDLQWKL